MDIVGYAIIKKDAKTCVSVLPVNSFTENRVRVMEFTDDGAVMVVNNEATAFASFEACDVISSFRCGVFGEYITPPDLTDIERLMYANRCMLRKGGYCNIVREMVIAASLHKGSFSDSFLWSKQ